MYSSCVINVYMRHSGTLFMPYAFTTIDNVHKSERYLVLRQHEYASSKYWIVAEVESPDDLKDESIQDAIAHESVFADDEAEIILVKVIGGISPDQARVDKILRDIEKENEEGR